MGKIFGEVRSYVLMTIGLLAYVIGWVVFLIPNNIVGGGVSGVGVVVNHFTGFPIGYTYFIINAVLMIIALKILGKGFGVKTVYAIIVVTIGFEVLPRILEMIPEGTAFGPKFYEDNGPLMCAIMGGIFTGAGIAIAIAQGGSTGGTDIIALLVTRRRNISPGRVLLYCDLIIIGSSYFVSHDFMRIIYGYILMAITSNTLDFLLSGSKQSVQMFIFSDKYAELADRISHDVNRGVSVLTATGWFSKDEHKVLLVIVRKHQSNEIYRIIKEIDNTAFVSVASVMSVFGAGFDTIKAKTKDK